MSAERLNQECFVSVLLSVLSVYLQEKAISSSALLLEGRYESCHLEKYNRHFSHRHGRCGQMVLSQMYVRFRSIFVLSQTESGFHISKFNHGNLTSQPHPKGVCFEDIYATAFFNVR